jgi:hypothetical protein
MKEMTQLTQQLKSFPLAGVLFYLYISHYDVAINLYNNNVCVYGIIDVCVRRGVWRYISISILYLLLVHVNVIG